MKLCLALSAFAAVSSATFNVDIPGNTTFWTVIRSSSSSSSSNTTVLEPVTTMTLTINSTMSGELTVYNNGFPSSTTTVVNMVEPTATIKASSTVLVLVPPHVRSTTTIRSTVSTYRLLVSSIATRTRHSSSTVKTTRRSSSTASSTRSKSIHTPVTTTTVTTKRCKTTSTARSASSRTVRSSKPTTWSTSFRTVHTSKPTTSISYSTKFRTVHSSGPTVTTTRTTKRCKDTSTSHSLAKTTITTSQGA